MLTVLFLIVIVAALAALGILLDWPARAAALFVLGLVILAVAAKWIGKLAQRLLFRSYRKRENIFSKTEGIFWKALQEAMPSDGSVLLAKVRMEDVIGVSDKVSARTRARLRTRVRSRHFDFVVCDRDGRIRMAIELDDSSHRTSAAAISADQFKNEVARVTGLRLVRIRARKKYDHKKLCATLAGD